MATHDYDIANQSGAAFRTDLNNALAAIQSNNSNSSSPSTTVAYQWWADTSNGVLKIRNSSNNAWVQLLQLDGTLTMEDGSASTPALAFRNDLDTGIFTVGADKFCVAAGGVQRMKLGSTTVFNEDGADVDFRIEGDNNANLFYADAGNDRVGIGTSSPSTNLDVRGSSTTGIKIQNSDDGTAELTFGNTGSDNMVIAQNSGNTTFSGGGSEYVRLDSSGRLLVGSASSRAVGNSNHSKFQIQSTTAGAGMSIMRVSDNTSPPFLRFGKARGGVGSESVVASDDQLGAVNFSGFDGTDTITQAASIAAFVDNTPGSNDMPGRLVFKTTGDGGSTPQERSRIDSSGRLFISTTSTSAVTGGSADAKFFDAADGCRLMSSRASTSIREHSVFHNPNGIVGSITTTGSATAFNTSSDYRLKENIVSISDGITRLKTLKPSRFNFIADKETIVDGFLAHEVTAVPEAIIGTKDEVDANNKPVYQKIDHSKLVPLLVAAVQELITKVETLESA